MKRFFFSKSQKFFITFISETFEKKIDEAVARHSDQNRKEKTAREKSAGNSDTMQPIRTQGELVFGLWYIIQFFR